MYRISNLQLIAIIFGSVIASGSLNMPQVAAGVGKSGGWIVVLLFGFLATAVAVILVKLMEYFPDENPITVIQQLTGGIGGYIFGLSIIIYTTLASATAVRTMAKVSSITMFQRTPLLVTIAILIILGCYLIYHGVEVIARVNEFLFPIKLVAFLAVMIMALPLIKTANLQPLWDRGSESWPTASPVLFIPYSGSLIIAFMYKNVNDKKRTLVSVVGAMLLVTVTYVVLTMLAIATFGANETARIIWPTVYMIKEIDIPVEPVFAAVWLTSVFTAAASFFYVATYTAGCLFKLADHRNILLPLGLLIIAIANTSMNQSENFLFDRYVGLMGIVLEWLLPIFLLLLALLFKKKGSSAR